MTIDRIVMVFAGLMILLGALLTVTVSPWFVIVPIFVGTNLTQAAFTRFCPLAKFLAAIGCERGCVFR